MVKNILFDLDGTLTDPKEGITKCVQYALEKFDINADCEELVPFIGPPLMTSFREFYGLSNQQCELAVKYYRERFAKVGLFENYPYEGISEVLAKLKKDGYINVDKDGYISLTELGREKSKSIFERHTVLTKMLLSLGVDEETADEDACRMEHVISEKTFDAMKNYLAQNE